MRLIDKAYYEYIRFDQTMGKTTSGKLTVLGLGLLGAYGHLKEGYELTSDVRNGFSKLCIEYKALNHKGLLNESWSNNLNDFQLPSISCVPSSLSTESTSVTYSAVTATTSTAVTFSILI